MSELNKTRSNIFNDIIKEEELRVAKDNSNLMSISMKHCLYKCDNDFEFTIKDEKKFQLVRDLIWQLHELGIVG